MKIKGKIENRRENKREKCIPIIFITKQALSFFIFQILNIKFIIKIVNIRNFFIL